MESLFSFRLIRVIISKNLCISNGLSSNGRLCYIYDHIYANLSGRIYFISALGQAVG